MRVEVNRPGPFILRAPMKKPLLVAIVIALLALGTWMLLGSRGSSSSTAASAQDAASKASAAPTPVIEFAATDLLTLAPRAMTRSIPLTGSLRPTDQTVVKARVAGDLRDLAVREGDAVRKGQVLGRIEPTEYQVRVTERQAQLTAAESQLAQARRNLDNTSQLKDRNFVSQSALDQARSGWEVAVANRDAAAAQLALARKSLGDAQLIAPIDGVVAERFAQPGEKLPIDGRVLSIVDLVRMEIEAPVPASEIGSVRIGQQVMLQIEGISRRQTGQIVRIAPSTQAGTRSVPVYIALQNRDPSVRAGLFAQGRLVVESREAVLALPAAAIRDSAARTFVYVLTDGILREREVSTGLRDDSEDGQAWVEIRSGLRAGEQIVAANLGRLRTGAPVKVIPAPATPGRGNSSGLVQPSR
jgi:RND family efflux transporter MFP subunit